MARKKYFQDHGDHLHTVASTEEFMEQILPTISDWIPVASAKAPVPAKPNMDFIALQQDNSAVTFLGLISITSRRNTFASSYPLAKGSVIQATISRIYEWKNGFEAYVWAAIGEDFEFCFFATDYFCNKAKYIVGAQLLLEIAALGLEISSGHEDITLDPEEAMKFYEHMEGGPDLDEDGNIAPLVMSCSELVALLPASDECPDLYEFHSPVRSHDDVTIAGKPFDKVGIVISHEPDDVEIPLYYNRELCPSLDNHDNIMGVLWLQAHIVDAFDYDETRN